MEPLVLSLFRTSDDSAHGSQSQGGFTATCALLSLAYNDPQHHFWLLELGIKPRWLTCEVNTIPLRLYGKVV